jgi:lysozyme family protein
MLRKFLLVLSIAFASVIPSFSQCSQTCKNAFEIVIKHEDYSMSGIVSHEPFGGVARFGVNSRAHPEAVRAGFYEMSKAKALRYAERVFYRGYWKPMHLDEINNERLANKLADLSYNLGPVRATILLQRALNMQGADLTAKGYFGEDTLEAINNLSPTATVVLVKYQAAGFYTRLARRHIEVMRGWRTVWLARNMEG